MEAVENKQSAKSANFRVLNLKSCANCRFLKKPGFELPSEAEKRQQPRFFVCQQLARVRFVDNIVANQHCCDLWETRLPLS